jgi:phosphoribosylamine--glycine ligase
MRLQSDLCALCDKALDGELSDTTAEWDPRPAIGVVMAAEGYPGSYGKGYPIEGLEAVSDADIKVFHAGTAREGGRVVTSGGRVLCVTALGDSIGQARDRAYAGVERIQWQGASYRRDIGWRAIERDTVMRDTDA